MMIRRDPSKAKRDLLKQRMDEAKKTVNNGRIIFYIVIGRHVKKETVHLQGTARRVQVVGNIQSESAGNKVINENYKLFIQIQIETIRITGCCR